MNTSSNVNQPLAVRARKRRARLAAALDQLPSDRKTERSDLELAINAIDSLLTGNTSELPDATAHDIENWLENTRNLALHH